MRTLSTLPIAFALVAGAPAPADADLKSIRWVGAVVNYDDASWLALTATSRSNLIFTCVAPDCSGGPMVYAYARPANDDSDQPGETCPAPIATSTGERRPLALVAPLVDGQPMDFTLFSNASGCRARDTPILEACATRGDVAYRLTTALRQGCNFGPALPQYRMIELLRGIRPDH
jgi:hypothetical protein